MKKSFLVILMPFLMACSNISINYDPVEYDKIVALTLIAENISNSCNDKNQLLFNLNLLSLNLRYIEKYSKYHNNNKELYNIISKLQNSVNIFKNEVNTKFISLDYCKLQSDFLTASTERTLQAVAKRR